MVYSGHSIIGCHCDGDGVAITLVEKVDEQEYHVLEDWYQFPSPGFSRVVDKCDEFFRQEAIKPNRKIEIFINNLLTLEKLIGKALKVYPTPVKIASIEQNEAFTLIASLLAEEKISLAPEISGLEDELKRFDPLVSHQNHRVYSLFNSIGQAEFNRIISPPPFYAMVRTNFAGQSIRSRCSSVFNDGIDD